MLEEKHKVQKTYRRQEDLQDLKLQIAVAKHWKRHSC